MLKIYSGRLGIAVKSVKGSETEYLTHDEVCRSIEAGGADYKIFCREAWSKVDTRGVGAL